MSSISLTPTQHAVLAHAIEHAEGRIEWFPPTINGGARQKVLDGLAKRELIRQAGKRWWVAAAGYDALGIPHPGVGKQGSAKFETQLDQIIANAEGAQADPATESLSVDCSSVATFGFTSAAFGATFAVANFSNNASSDVQSSVARLPVWMPETFKMPTGCLPTAVPCSSALSTARETTCEKSSRTSCSIAGFACCTSWRESAVSAPTCFGSNRTLE